MLRVVCHASSVSLELRAGNCLQQATQLPIAATKTSVDVVRHSAATPWMMLATLLLNASCPFTSICAEESLTHTVCTGLTGLTVPTEVPSAVFGQGAPCLELPPRLWRLLLGCSTSMAVIADWWMLSMLIVGEILRLHTLQSGINVRTGHCLPFATPVGILAATGGTVGTLAKMQRRGHVKS